MAGFSVIKIFITLLLIHAGTTDAYMCMCSPASCVLIKPSADFFDTIEIYCSSFRNRAKDVSIIRLMETTLPATAFTKFPNMVSMEIFQGNLTQLEPNTFASAQNLLKLLIKGNHLTSLGDYIFKGADNIKDLMISSSPLSSVSANAFANLKHLEILILSHGHLTGLPNNLFENNRMLKIISLNGNQIERIDSHTFDGLNELTKLELAENRLTVFDCKDLRAPTVLLSNNSLEHLVINEYYTSLHAAHNKISSVTVDGVNLAKLSVVNNQIRDITNLTKLTNLTSLSLGSNPLNPDTVFSSFKVLEELMLQMTYINLTAETFANLESLRVLDLSYNNLTEANFDIFASQQMSLQILSYVGNRIQHFNYILAKEFLPSLRVLEICKNGWNNTYFVQNIARMKNLELRPDIYGFATHILFRDDYVEACAEKLFDDYSYDESSESSSYVDVNEEIRKAFPEDTTTTSTTTPAATSIASATMTTSTGATTTTTSRSGTVTLSPDQTRNSVHHVFEYNTRVTVNPVEKTREPTQQSSPYFIIFQVMMYIFAIFGIVALAAGVYFWKVRGLSLQRRNTSVEPADVVRLI